VLLCCVASTLQPTAAADAVDAQFAAPSTCPPQITPAHDAKDFATGKRNNLEFINILNDDGTLNERCGPYAGRPRYEVRQRTVPAMPPPALTFDVRRH
jgi:valyl-tRNA synthetase